MLTGKTVVLGISGSIAAYKIAYLASALKKLHADVEVIMTENATQFITPVTFESLTGNKCLVDTFDRNFKFSVEHVALAKRADIFMLAPATANVIAKVAHGLADDTLRGRSKPSERRMPGRSSGVSLIPRCGRSRCEHPRSCKRGCSGKR